VERLATGCQTFLCRPSPRWCSAAKRQSLLLIRGALGCGCTPLLSLHTLHTIVSWKSRSDICLDSPIRHSAVNIGADPSALGRRRRCTTRLARYVLHGLVVSCTLVDPCSRHPFATSRGTFRASGCLHAVGDVSPHAVMVVDHRRGQEAARVTHGRTVRTTAGGFLADSATRDGTCMWSMFVKRGRWTVMWTRRFHAKRLASCGTCYYTCNPNSVQGVACRQATLGTHAAVPALPHAGLGCALPALGVFECLGHSLPD